MIQTATLGGVENNIVPWSPLDPPECSGVGNAAWSGRRAYPVGSNYVHRVGKSPTKKTTHVNASTDIAVKRSWMNPRRMGSSSVPQNVDGVRNFSVWGWLPTFRISDHVARTSRTVQKPWVLPGVGARDRIVSLLCNQLHGTGYTGRGRYGSAVPDGSLPTY